MRIFCIGCTGLVGQHLLPALLAAGHQVSVLIHRSKPKWLPDQVTLVHGADSFDENVSSSDVVINLAGANVGAQPWTPQRMRLLRSSRIDPTARVVRGGPRWLINASGVSWYGYGSQVADETTPGVSNGFLCGLAQEWEQAARGPGTHALTTLRIGVVLAAAGGVLERFLPPWPIMPVILGRGAVGLPWIHIDDVVGAILHILKEGIEGPVNLVAPEAHSSASLMTVLHKVARRPGHPPHVPGALLRALLGPLSELVLKGRGVMPTRLRDHAYAFRFSTLHQALVDCVRPGDSQTRPQ